MKRKRKVDGGAADGSGEAAGGSSTCTDSEDGLAWSVDTDVEEVVLPGVDDPAVLEQFALWKERRFTDVWLQVRPSLSLSPNRLSRTTAQAGHVGAPEGPRIPGTRMLLASVSPYIRKLLLGTQQIPGLQGDTIFVDVSGGAEALAQLVEVRGRAAAARELPLHERPSLNCPAQALYSRRLRLSMRGAHSVLDVLRVANFLAVACVLDAARQFLASHLRAGNALRVAALAEAHGLPEAKSAALRFAGEHFEELLACPKRYGLTGLDQRSLMSLLSSDALRVDGELGVFRALMHWLDTREEEEGAASAVSPHPAVLPPSASEVNAHPTPPCPPHLLALIRLQHIPLEALYREVSPHPRMQAVLAKQCIIDTSAFHHSVANPADAPLTAQPPRRYARVDARIVRVGTVLRVLEDLETVRRLCDTLPPDQPIKFVGRMTATVGQRGEIVQKSRRGALKLRFEGLSLPEDRKDYWFPAEALTLRW